jgi:hypothetical protein
LATFEELFWVVMGFAFMSVPGAAFLDASTVEMLGEQRDAYGKFRLWGAVGFGAGAGLFGVVDKYWGWQYPFYLYGGVAVTQAWLVATTPDFLGRIKKERGAREQHLLAMRHPARSRSSIPVSQAFDAVGPADDDIKQHLLANASGDGNSYGSVGGGDREGKESISEQQHSVSSPGLKEFIANSSNAAAGALPNGERHHLPLTPPAPHTPQGSPALGLHSSNSESSLLSSSLLTDDGRGGQVFPGSSAYGSSYGGDDSMSEPMNTSLNLRGGSSATRTPETNCVNTPPTHLSGVAEDHVYSNLGGGGDSDNREDADTDEEAEMVKGCDGKMKKKGSRPCADLFCTPHYLLFMFAVTVMGIGCTSLGAFLQLFLKDIGANNFLIGLSVTAQTVPEVPLFWFSERMLKCMGARLMLVVGMAGFVLRSWLTSIIPNHQPYWILPVQVS